MAEVPAAAAAATAAEVPAAVTAGKFQLAATAAEAPAVAATEVVPAAATGGGSSSGGGHEVVPVALRRRNFQLEATSPPLQGPLERVSSRDQGQQKLAGVIRISFNFLMGFFCCCFCFAFFKFVTFFLELF